MKKVIAIFCLLPAILHCSVIAPYSGDGVAAVDDKLAIYYAESVIEKLCDDAFELPCIPHPAEDEEQEDANTSKRFGNHQSANKQSNVSDFCIKANLPHCSTLLYTSVIFSPIAMRMRYVITVLSTPV